MIRCAEPWLLMNANIAVGCVKWKTAGKSAIVDEKEAEFTDILVLWNRKHGLEKVQIKTIATLTTTTVTGVWTLINDAVVSSVTSCKFGWILIGCWHFYLPSKASKSDPMLWYSRQNNFLNNMFFVIFILLPISNLNWKTLHRTSPSEVRPPTQEWCLYL